MNKRHYEHTLPNIRGSLSNTYDKGRFVRYAIGQDHQVAPVCILTLQRKTIWRLQIESGREKVEAKQSAADSET